MKWKFAALLLASTCAYGQGVRFDANVLTSATNVQAGAQSTVFTVPNARITVCEYPSVGQPCTNTTPIFSDKALTVAIPQPLSADAHGRFGFWAAAGTYSYSVVNPATGSLLGTYPITLGGADSGNNTGGSGVVGGVWNSTQDYPPGAVVTFGGHTYLSIVDNTNVQPDTSVDFWTDISIGGTPTSTALRVGTYTGSVVGGTGQLTGSNLSTDATGSDIGARNVTATTQVAVTGPGAGMVVTGAGATPTIPAASAGITSDTSGNLLGFDATGNTGPICTATNGKCPTGSGGTSTSTAYRVGTYTSGVTGGTGNLTGSNISTDATGSDLGVRNIQSSTSTIRNTNCAHPTPDGTLTCEEINDNAHLAYRSGGSGLNNLRYDKWQVTGPGWNIGPVLGTTHNQGWRVMIQHEKPSIILSRGIHEGEGDGGLGWDCFAVGDCIHRYDYDYYDGGSPDPSAESKKWQAVIQTETQGFFRGTVTNTTVAAGTAPYPTTSKVVTVNLGLSSGPNHITDGTKLMYDPNAANTTACSFNGPINAWSAGGQIGRIPITGCSGAAIPTLYAWGTINALIGDLPANGDNPSNVPVQQTWAFVPGAGSPAFAAPDGITEWKSHACIVGLNYIENSRLESVSGSNITLDVRYPNNGPVMVLQGPACAPYQSVSIDASLTYGQQASSFWSFGTIDGGATLLMSSQSGGSVGWNSIFRPGVAPWTTTSSFHLVNSSEIVANASPNAFSPLSAQVEDNGFLPANGTAVWDPHYNSVSSMVFSVVDGTSQYGGGAAQSGIGYYVYNGSRVTSAYQPMYFWNSNDPSMYRFRGGWADPPNSVIATEGVHLSFADLSHAPSGAFATVHDVYSGITDWDLFRLPRQSIGVHANISTYNITNTALSGGTATYTYTVTSGYQPTLVPGEAVTVLSTTNGGGILNGTFTIAAVTGTTSGTFTVTGFGSGTVAPAPDGGAAVTGANYIDFAHGGANGIRTSYLSMNKNGNINLGLFNSPAPNDAALGTIVDPGSGTVNADGTLHLHNLITDLINGSAPGTGGGSGGGVTSFNSLTGPVTISAGTGIAITPVGSNITITNTLPSGASGGGATVASAEVVTFSATPTFSTATNVSRITLASNISSFTLGAGADGQSKTLCFKQGADGPDAYTVGHPANVHGFFAVGTSVNTWSCQTFTYDLTDSMWLASSLGVLNQ